MLHLRKGISALELVIAIALVGVLAAIASERVGMAIQVGDVTAMKSDLHNLVVAEEAYFADSSAYTDDLGALKFHGTRNVAAPVITASGEGWSATVTQALHDGSVTCGLGFNAPNPVVASAANGEPTCRF